MLINILDLESHIPHQISSIDSKYKFDLFIIGKYFCKLICSATEQIKIVWRQHDCDKKIPTFLNC
jgi:hypothetical protein